MTTIWVTIYEASKNEMDVWERLPIILTTENEIENNGKWVIRNSMRLTNCLWDARWIKGTLGANRSYMCLHHNTIQANWHQYIQFTSMRVEMLK